MKLILQALKHLITLAIILVACATAFTAWSVRIPPEEAGKLCLGWFAFPYLWLLMLVIIIVTFAFRSWFACFCCAAVVVATWGSARQVVDIPTSEEGIATGSKTYKLITYNVHYLGYGDELTVEHARDSICTFLLASNADVICLQECTAFNFISKQTHGQGDELLEKYPYQLTFNDDRGGQTILSHIPLEKVDKPAETVGKLGEMNTTITADIRLGDDTVRIINCHLASLRLTSNEINAVSRRSRIDNERASTLHTTYDKLRNAFIERQTEANLLAKAIETSPHPTIVCGDFNDTPISYTYHMATNTKRHINDARAPHRLGLARTYRGNLPPLRIDYVLTTDEIATEGYTEYDMPTSDHKAVSISFAMKSVK